MVTNLELIGNADDDSRRLLPHSSGHQIPGLPTEYPKLVMIPGLCLLSK